MRNIHVRNCYECPFRKTFPGEDRYEVSYCSIPPEDREGKAQEMKLLEEKDMKKRPWWCELWHGVTVG